MDGGASVVMMSEVGAKSTVIAITNYQPPCTPSYHLFTNASNGEVVGIRTKSTIAIFSPSNNPIEPFPPKYRNKEERKSKYLS